jgi:hypothetical protein
LNLKHHPFHYEPLLLAADKCLYSSSLLDNLTVVKASTMPALERFQPVLRNLLQLVDTLLCLLLQCHLKENGSNDRQAAWRSR